MYRLVKILTVAISIIIYVSLGSVIFSDSVYATTQQLGKPEIKSVKATSTTSVTVKWKKVNGASGYIVYRNGKPVVTTSVRADSFVQKGLKPGTNYWYRVRAYKNYTIRQYYNTKTRKWQNTQPKRKYRGGVRMTLARKFGTVTGATKVTTKKPVCPKPSTPSIASLERTQSGLKVTSSSASGASGYIFYRYDYSTGKTNIVNIQESKVFVDKKTSYGSFYKYSVKAYKRAAGCVTSYSNMSAKSADTEGITPSSNSETTSGGNTKPSGGTTPTTPKDNSINTEYGKIYPNADGSFNMSKGKYYTDAVNVGGVNISGLDFVSIFPSGTKFYVDASNMGGCNWAYQGTSSNSNVGYIISDDYLDAFDTCSYICMDLGLYFANTGTTNVNVKGKTFTFIVTKANANNAKFINTVHDIEANAQGLYGRNKVGYYVEYITNTYKYPNPCYEHNAYDMVIKGTGDCWAGNGFLAYLCGRAGFPVEIRYAGADRLAASGHRNCVITINDTKYIGDATPEFVNDDRNLMLYDDYMQRYGQ